MKRDFEEVREILLACGAANGAAEFHGIVCGQVSSGHGGLRLDLCARLLGLEQALPPVLEQLILDFASDIAGQLLAGDFAFQPLLPDEDEELGRRVEALGRWCEGFNMGFAAGYAVNQAPIQAETREVINDFARLAQMDEGLSADAFGEQDERDFTEILEYVRMAAASVFMQNVPAPPQPGPDDNIH